MRVGMRAGILIFLVGIWLPMMGRAAPLTVDISSHFVAINTGFTGADVVVFGAAEENSDVIVELRGPSGLATIRQKERVLGIWVNTRSVRFRDAPSFYAASASAPVASLLSLDKRRRMTLGADQLGVLSLDSVDPQAQEAFRLALIDDRVRHGLYVPGMGDVVFIGQGLFRTNFYLPSNVPTGLYQVRVWLVRGGEVISQSESPLYVGKVGTSAELFRFAHNQAFFYGVAAIVFAACSGWAAAWLFRRM